MSDNLTLEARMDLMARSVAPSHDVAVALVRRLADLSPAYLFCGARDVDLMYSMAPDEIDEDDLDVDSYKGLCCLPSMMMHRDHQADPDVVNRPKDPCATAWSVRTTNMILLFGLMLYDQAKNRWKHREIYTCTRMTLTQYVAALTELVPGYEKYVDLVMEQNDGNQPLADALGGILRRYLGCWTVYQGMDYVAGITAQACMLGPDDGDEFDRLFEQAQTFSVELPDLFSDEIPGRAVRERIFMPDREYSQKSFRRLTATAPYQSFRELLAFYTDSGRLEDAMSEINVAVIQIYLLFVEPFRAMCPGKHLIGA